MATLQQNISRITTALPNIATAIDNKGVTVPTNTTIEDIPFYISQIQQGGTGGSEWTRPSERPPLPVTQLSDNDMYILYKVSPNAINDMVIGLTLGDTTNVSLYTNWGDGSAEELWETGISTKTHVYDFNSITAPINADGSKWIWIKTYNSAIGTSTGGITTFNMPVRPSTRGAANNYTPNGYELYTKLPYLTTISNTTTATNRWQLLEIADFQGTNQITTGAQNFLYSSFQLRQLNIDTSTWTNFSNFLGYCTQFNQQLNIDTSHATVLSGFMTGCYSYSHIINLNLSNFVSAFPSFGSLYGLKGIRLQNTSLTNGAIAFNNTNLNADAAALLFGDLYDRTGQTAVAINILGTPAASNLSDTQIAIATSKNYTITGRVPLV